MDISFVSSLAYAPLLKFSPVEALISGYYPDGVGQSVIDSNRRLEYVEHDEKKRTPRKVWNFCFSNFFYEIF